MANGSCLCDSVRTEVAPGPLNGFAGIWQSADSCSRPLALLCASKVLFELPHGREDGFGKMAEEVSNVVFLRSCVYLCTLQVSPFALQAYKTPPTRPLFFLFLIFFHSEPYIKKVNSTCAMLGFFSSSLFLLSKIELAPDDVFWSSGLPKNKKLSRSCRRVLGTAKWHHDRSISLLEITSSARSYACRGIRKGNISVPCLAFLAEALN